MFKEGSNQLQFGSKLIHFDLSFQDRKTLGIKVYPSTKVKVIAPPETAPETINEKLVKKAPWIIKQQNEFLSFHPLTPAREYVGGETHLYLGRQYRLKVQQGSKPSVKLSQGRMIVSCRDESQVERTLRTWYRERATLWFNELLELCMERFRSLNIVQPDLQLREMPTRWGSCTVKGKVILNPELIKAPKACIEYVIVHELCHLVHHSHNKAFYELQSAIMPSWKKWKQRLEEVMV